MIVHGGFTVEMVIILGDSDNFLAGFLQMIGKKNFITHLSITTLGEEKTEKWPNDK